MKQEWSKRWISSVQPRKQRKYRYNAPLHVRQKFVSASLSSALRERFGKRSMSLRKGDEIEVMRGGFKGQRGVVDRVDLSKTKIYVDEIKVKKSDGSEVMRALQPSNLRIVKLNLDDKKRQAILDRVKPAEPKTIEKKAEKPAESREKPAEKMEPKEAKKPAPKKSAPNAVKAPARKSVATRAQAKKASHEKVTRKPAVKKAVKKEAKRPKKAAKPAKGGK